MAEQPKIFVAALQPAQQNVLRLLLNNYFKIQMKILLDHLPDRPTASDIDKKWRRLRGMLDSYEAMTYNYPLRENLHHHKAKLMFFNQSTMRYIADSISVYSSDPAENTLDGDSIKLVNEYIDGLDKLMKVSSKCDFSPEDIKKIKG